MAWRVLIGDGAGQVVINASTSFSESRVRQVNDSGATEYIDRTFTFVGDVEAATPALVADRIRVLAALTRGAAVRVRFQLNLVDVADYDLLPANHSIGPLIRVFDTLPDEGSGESHWPHKFEVFAREPGVVSGGGQTAPPTTEIRRSIVTEKYKKTIVRKLWRISVKAKSITDALTFVLARKPSASPLREIIERAKDEARVTAEWTWEAAKGSVIEFSENPPEWIEPAPRVVVQRRVRKPVLFHAARREAGVLRFSGTIRALAKDDGSAPNLAAIVPTDHVAAGANVVKVATEGGRTPGAPVLIDAVQGVYELQWEQRYMYSGGTPAISHGTHNRALAPSDAQEPPDGNFFS